MDKGRKENGERKGRKRGWTGRRGRKGAVKRVKPRTRKVARPPMRPVFRFNELGHMGAQASDSVSY